MDQGRRSRCSKIHPVDSCVHGPRSGIKAPNSFCPTACEVRLTVLRLTSTFLVNENFRFHFSKDHSHHMQVQGVEVSQELDA